MRNLVALIAIILALLFVVRPLMRILKDKAAVPVADGAEDDSHSDPAALPASALVPIGGTDPGDLREQVDLARKLAREQPDRAADALRRMLASPRQDQPKDRAA